MKFDVNSIPWEGWLALLRRIAYNVTVGWITGDAMPLHFSFEVGGRVVLVMGTVTVESHPLPLPNDASDDVKTHVDQAVKKATSDVKAGTITRDTEGGADAGAKGH